ncbi:MAG: sulfite exporter TauE/SafE family protein [Thermaerobacter sp.]|nr:sulfite exporter TauE/SafE family protein [Thermaerobacter sp.]
MMEHLTWGENLAAVGSGTLASLFMAVVGGGASALAMPLLMSAVGLESSRLAMGTTTLSVAVSALIGAVPHFRQGTVSWAAALGFGGAAAAGVWLGRQAGITLSRHGLLVGVALLMLPNAWCLLKRPSLARGHAGRFGRWPLWAQVGPLGFGVGLIAGVAGMGGGFLVMPGMMATGMPMATAVGSSLISVGALGAANGALYAWRGWVDWHVVIAYAGGGLLGSGLGAALTRRLGQRARILPWVAAVVISAAAVYLLTTNVRLLWGHLA